MYKLCNFIFFLYRYTPSKADLSVFEALGKLPAGDFPHVQRWYRHIASYTAQEKNSWGGSALPQAAGGKPTVDSKAKGNQIHNLLFLSL